MFRKLNKPQFSGVATTDAKTHLRAQANHNKNKNMTFGNKPLY